MSLITSRGLIELVEMGAIEGVDPKRINGASIDVTLGDVVWSESPLYQTVDLAKKGVPNMNRHNIDGAPYTLHPGEFILAQTREVFSLPDDVACEFRLKSSSARAGLDQALAVWCDPGWTGSVLTMELRNNLTRTSLILTAGMPIGQMVFWRGEKVSDDQSYRTRGQYNGDRQATQSKGLR